MFVCVFRDPGERSHDGIAALDLLATSPAAVPQASTIDEGRTNCQLERCGMSANYAELALQVPYTESDQSGIWH